MENGYCYLTIPMIKKRTLYGKDMQRVAIKKLIAAGLIERKVCGFPKKQYFKVVRYPHSAENRSSVGGNPPIIERKTDHQSAENRSSVGGKHALNKTRDNTKEIKLENKTRYKNNKDNLVIKTYESKYGPIYNNIEFEKMMDDIKTYGDDWSMKALEKTISENEKKPPRTRRWPYARAILKGWQENYGLDCKEPWEEDKKRGSNKGYIKQKEVDWANEPEGLV